jgi:methylglutaconyl-CoA hydratase
MAFERLEIERDGAVARVWLNRPDKRNALDRMMVDELRAAFEDLGADASVRGIVLGGRGTAFCAGADLAYLQAMSRFDIVENMEDSSALASTLRTIYDCPKPVIARVHGPAIAGGCGLATVCDVVVATSSASFGYTEVLLGFIPAIVLAFLIRRVGEIQFRELVLGGRILPASEARERGLVTTVVESSDELDSTINELCKQFERASPSAIAMTKKMIVALDGMSLDAALDYASRMNAIARSTPDCVAGVAKFLDSSRR